MLPKHEHDNGFGKLPPCILTRIFEYLFWIGMCDDDMNIFTSVPLGHRAILPSLQVNHAWRKRAARLFYGYVSIVVGCGHTTIWEMPTRYAKNLGLRTNVRLVLESGYAPKATRLVVYSNSSLQPMQMAAALDQTGFLDYVWEGINMLYFFHPHGLEDAAVAGLWGQDQGIAQVNDGLAQCLPNMTRIKALSNTRDSFGLFALDDLINARLDHMEELVVLSHGSLILGAQELPSTLCHLVIRTTMGINRERNADDSQLDTGSTTEEQREEGDPIFAGSESYPSDSDISSAVGGEVASSYSSSHLSRHMRSKSASSSGSAQIEMPAALRIPNICSKSLVSLELGPISPDNIWDSFIHPQSLVFSNLKSLRLVFSSPLLLPNSDEKKHRFRYRRQHLHWSGSRRQSSAASDASSIHEPQFPCLESLSLTAYPYDIDEMLETFPCSQLRSLELTRCPHKFFQLSLENSFAMLERATIDIPSSRNRRKEQEIDDWISRTLRSRLLYLQVLSLSTPSEHTRHIDLPGEYGMTNIHYLRLNTGMKLVEIEKLLAGLPNLRTVDVTVTEVMGKTHEYLSRTARPGKYTGKWSWRGDCQCVLSISLEDLIIRYTDLSYARLRRAVAKTVLVASRVPSILRISTPPMYLDMLRDCIAKATDDKAPSSSEACHMNRIQLLPIVGNP